MQILLLILGGILGYWLYMLAVALANLILGPVLGYRYHMISFYSMMLANRNGKMVPSMSNVSFIPIVQLQPKVVSRGKRIILEFGPILPGGLMCAGVYYLSFFQSEAMAPLFVKTAIMLGIFLIIHFVLNFVIFVKMFGNGTTAYLFKEENKIISMLSEGIHPKDIAFNDNVQGVDYFSNPNYHHFDMCRYYHALENNDVEKMSELISKMYDRLGVIWSETKIPFFYEVLYYYTAIEKDVTYAEGFVNTIIYILERDKSVTGRRVYASYLYYTGKSVEVVKDVIMQGLQVADKHPLNGLGKMERNILNELLRTIGEKENEYVYVRY